MSSSSRSRGGETEHEEHEALDSDSPIRPVTRRRKTRVTVPWKADEDDRLRRACNEADLSWAEIAKKVGGGRTVKSCSGRYARLFREPTVQGPSPASPTPETPSKLAGVWRHKRIIVSPEEDDDDNDPGPPSPVKTPVESGPVPSPSPSSQRRNLIEPPTPDPDSKSTLVHSHTPHTSHIGSLSSLEGIRIPEEDELAAIEASNGRLARLVAARKRTLELSEEFKMLPTPLTSRSGVEVKSEDSKVVKMEDSQPSKKQKVGPRRKSKGKGRESDLIDLTLSDDD